MSELKVGARNRADDKRRIREIRAAARQIDAHTLEMEPDDEDGPTDSEMVIGKSTRVQIKALTEDTITVAGYGVVFGGADLEGETFGPATEYMLDLVPTKLVMYDHALGQVKHVIGKTATVAADENGLWVEAELDRHAAYVELIRELAEKGALGWSSGSVGHLVQRAGKSITRWPIVEFSLTPTPAEPRTLGVEVLKSLAEVDATYSVLLPEAEASAVQDTDGAEADATNATVPVTKEVTIMGDENTPTIDVAAIAQDAATKAVTAFAAQQTPTNAIPVAKASAPPVIESLGDSETKAWGAYLRYGDDGGIKHLRNEFGYEMKASNATDMNIGTPADGGYTVPTGHLAQIIARRDESMLATRLGVRMIPGIGTTVRVPLDNEDDGEFVLTSEASNSDQDAPALYYKDLTLAMYTKYILLSNQLLNDSDTNILAFLEEWVGRGLAKTHNSLLLTEVAVNGTSFVTFDSGTVIGAGEPQEVIGNDALDPYLDDTGSVAWVMRPSTHNHIMSITGDGFLYLPSPAGTGNTLLGYPVLYSSKAAAIATGAKTVYFGNWNFVGRREAPGITFLRDPYSASRTGQLALHYYTQVVYGVLQAEAVGYGIQA